MAAIAVVRPQQHFNLSSFSFQAIAHLQVGMHIVYGWRTTEVQTSLTWAKELTPVAGSRSSPFPS